MGQIIEKQICTGCYACCSICPRQCIVMEPDREGFVYPRVDQSRCVSCGLCKKVCPVLHKYQGNPQGKAYACVHKDEKIRMKSSSGGIFTLCAEYVLDQGGAVFGAAFDEHLMVHHVCARAKEDLSRLRGSKYLQSRIEDTYREAEACIKAGKLVLFSGTPCQIGGLKSFLGKEYDRLMLQDIFCHGVPSPKVWNRYLDFHRTRSGSIPDADLPPSFRFKDKGWRQYEVFIRFASGETYRKPFNEDLYMKAFLSNLSLRPSCYQCHYKTLERESDITLADFWGIEKVSPGLDDDGGTSLILVNTPKGERLLEAVKEKMIYKKVDMDEAVQYNSAAYQSALRPEGRGKFFEQLEDQPFDRLVIRATKNSLCRRGIGKAKRIIKSIIAGGDS